MTAIRIQGSDVTVRANIDLNYSSATDYLSVWFGPLSLGMYDADERKAFIAALQAADAELGAAAGRGKPGEAA